MTDDAACEIDRRIVEGYLREPPEDILDAEVTGREMIAAEPWEPPGDAPPTRTRRCP